MDLAKVFLSQNVIVLKEVNEGGDGDACFVQSIKGKEFTLITAEKGLSSVPPEVGEAIVIQCNRMEGTYSAHARVTACEHQTDDTGERVLRIQAMQLGKVIRVQRRDYFRVKMQMKVEIRAPRRGIVGPIALMTDDISAGGLRVVSPKRLDKGVVLAVSLHLPDKRPPVACGGKVVRCTPVQGNAYELSIVLRRVLPADEDRIVQVLTKVIRDTIQAMRDQG